MHKTTTELKLIPKIMDANLQDKRYTIHQGGTGSGKTWSILQWIGYYGIHSKMPLTVSIVAESYRHLKRGALRDFRKLASLLNWPYSENKTDHTFSFKNTTIEFVSAAEPDKLRGARRDILYINECNRVPFESFNQLDSRTRQRTFLDFNPTSRFWVHDKLIPTLTALEYTFTKSTYTDNAFLLTAEKDNIERRRNNVNWWKVYGEGEIGVTEGTVFSKWEITNCEDVTLKRVQGDCLPQGHTELVSASHKLPGNLLGYGIDFGFTHSPTAIVQVNESNGELYVRELLYKNNMQNDALFAFAQAHLDLNALAIADSAEPKTIEYLYRKGWKGIKPAIKGPDSVQYGINLLSERRINVTADSPNLIRELQEYRWDTNYEGKIIDTPVKANDHAIDALRYVYSYPKKKKIIIS